MFIAVSNISFLFRTQDDEWYHWQLRCIKLSNVTLVSRWDTRGIVTEVYDCPRCLSSTSSHRLARNTQRDSLLSYYGDSPLNSDERFPPSCHGDNLDAEHKDGASMPWKAKLLNLSVCAAVAGCVAGNLGPAAITVIKAWMNYLRAQSQKR